MRLAITWLAVVFLCSCGLRIRGWGTIGGATVDAVPSPNPLTGRALTISVEGSSEIEVLGAESCSFWPILDEYQVTADSTHVCVKAEMFLLSYESGPLPIETIEVGLANDARPPTMFDLAAEGQLRKVGRCYGSDRQRTGVWSFRFQGCTPNNGLITDQTQTLALRRRKGLFSGTEGTELAKWAFLPAPSASPRPVAVAAAAAPAPQARTLYEEGTVFLRQQRYPEALERLSQCLDLDPQLSQGYVARGNALLGLHRFTEALADYEYALTLDSKSALPLYGLGEASRGLNDKRKARVYFQRFMDSPLVDATPSLKQDVARKLASLK